MNNLNYSNKFKYVKIISIFFATSNLMNIPLIIRFYDSLSHKIISLFLLLVNKYLLDF
jgi:hypothetical protein